LAFALAFGSAAALAASPAFAHIGIGATSGLMAGLAHPFAGIDHTLAMLAVGLVAAFGARGREWRPPVAFVSAMVVGAGLAFAGILLPQVESAIALSVVLLGLLVAGAGSFTMPASVVFVLSALFGLVHGHAHGLEASGTVAGYIAGFVLGSGILHAIGYVAGRSLSRIRAAGWIAGGAIAAAGLALLAG
jgi:urease accessory protein